jgi:hypothetical protein
MRVEEIGFQGVDWIRVRPSKGLLIKQLSLESA